MENTDLNEWELLFRSIRQSKRRIGWNGYTITEDTHYDVFWAYAPTGGCLLAAGSTLAEAKKVCYEHFDNKPTELP